MKFTYTSMIAGLAISASCLTSHLAVAAPLSPETAVIQPAPSSFNLQVTSSDARINNKCLSTYHTGAGLNDIILGPCSSAGSSSKPQFIIDLANPAKINYVGFANSPIPAQIQAYDGSASYDGWARVVANLGAIGTDFSYTELDGFKMKSTGLGFLACRWSHGNAWQLFAVSRGAPDTFPASCAEALVKKSFAGR